MVMIKRTIILVIALAAATLTQGCAVFYASEKTDVNGSTDREFGLFGGCLPLWHYRSVKPTPDPKPKGANEAPAHAKDEPKQ
jgi:hypothetical protein